jgi:hypothetical protein
MKIRTFGAVGISDVGEVISKVDAIETDPELFARGLAEMASRYAAMRSQVEETSASDVLRAALSKIKEH